MVRVTTFVAMNPETPTLVDLDETSTAVIRGRDIPVPELPAFFDSAFGTLAATLGRQGVQIAGPAFASYDGPLGATASPTVGFPTVGEVSPEGEVEASSLPGGRVARTVHRGGYETLGESWESLRLWILNKGLQLGDVLWESYTTEPNPEMDPSDLTTELNWTIAE